MPELATSDDERTGAIYGFIKGLSWCRHQTKIPIYHTVVIWDGGHAEERKRIYPDYKKGRRLNEDKAEREDYFRQLEAIREILHISGCRQIKVDGAEADDIISIFTFLLREQRDDVVIFSGDGDFHQLYGQRVMIFDPKKEMLGAGDIKKKWTVPPGKILLKKALVGDSSDNIKGVPKIGDKRTNICCAFMGLRFDKHTPTDPGKQWRLCVEKNGAEGTDAKWVGHAMEHKKLVNRNIKLMRLPRSWEESYYDEDQALEAMEQWLTKPKKNRRRFIELLRRYEMDSILENLSNW